MIINYIPDMCGYGLNNLKKVIHIFSESANVIHIDNGEAYVASGITDLQTISATSVSFEETTAYDDRFKFQKTVTVTVNGFAKLSALGGKYYIVLEDVNGIMWLVNADFPSLVTYTYTLQDGTDETVFTFSALSNFPTLKLNASINNAYACQNYSLVRVDEIKMLEKRYANIYTGNSVVYGYSNQVYKTVRPYRNSIKVEETFDGTNANTTIQFSIGLDDYQSSWHYNMLEYPYNKYVAVIDHLACGFEMGLVPSYNVQGSHQIGGGDTVTVTLVGGSQRGSEWANSWLEVTIPPQYTWRLSDEWACMPKRKYELRLNDSSVVSAECDSTSAITSGEVSSQYSGTVVSVEIGNCVTNIGVNAFQECTELTNVTLPNSLTSIGEGAFNYCTRLTGITIPDSVINIDSVAFAACSALTSVIIPDSVTHIGNIFEWCYGLRSCTLGTGITEIPTWTFWDCRNLREIVIPGNAASIGQEAFRGCYRLSAITIENGVGSIGYRSFWNCRGLTSIDLPDSMTSIGRYAFSGCTALTDVTIGTGIKTINESAFHGCSALTSCTINALTPPTLKINAFALTRVRIYVPCESLDAYKTAWSGQADRIYCIPDG